LALNCKIFGRSARLAPSSDLISLLQGFICHQIFSDFIGYSVAYISYKICELLLSSQKMVWQQGKKLKNSKYLLKKVLGGGGFGVTYKIIEQFSNISKIQSTLSTQDQKIKLTESQISDAKYQFDILTVNERGEEIKREKNKVGYFTENLGNGVEMDMVAIPGATFMMGTEDEEIERLEKKYNWCDFRREKPQHEVTVPSFYMGKFPVTQEQWKAVAQLPQLERKLEPEPSSYKGDNQLPVEFVSWEEAVEFCNRLSKATTKEYRLPTEAA